MLQLKTCKAAEHMDSLKVKHALQQTRSRYSNRAVSKIAQYYNQEAFY